MKTIIHQFDPIIYPVKLWIAIDENPSHLPERFSSFPDGKDYSVVNINERYLAFTDTVICKESEFYGVLIFFFGTEAATIKTIAHEATHAARYIWDQIREGATGTEADAYLVGWIAECIETVKNESNK